MRIITDSLGFRCTALLVIGAAQFLQGLSYVMNATPGRDRAFAWIAQAPIIPQSFGSEDAGCLLVVSGLTLIVLAPIAHQHPWLQKYGFMIAMVPWILWACIFITAFILRTHPNGMAGGISYAAWSALVYLMAGWTDPPSKTSIQMIREAKERAGDTGEPTC